MVFSPLFINTDVQEGLTFAKQAKLKSTNYLFSDIINVFINNEHNESGLPTLLKGKQTELPTLDVKSLFQNDQISLTQISQENIEDVKLTLSVNEIANQNSSNESTQINLISILKKILAVNENELSENNTKAKTTIDRIETKVDNELISGNDNKIVKELNSGNPIIISLNTDKGIQSFLISKVKQDTGVVEQSTAQSENSSIKLSVQKIDSDLGVLQKSIDKIKYDKKDFALVDENNLVVAQINVLNNKEELSSLIEDEDPVYASKNIASFVNSKQPKLTLLNNNDAIQNSAQHSTALLNENIISIDLVEQSDNENVKLTLVKTADNNINDLKSNSDKIISKSISGEPNLTDSTTKIHSKDNTAEKTEKIEVMPKAETAIPAKENVNSEVKNEIKVGDESKSEKITKNVLGQTSVNTSNGSENKIATEIEKNETSKTDSVHNTIKSEPKKIVNVNLNSDLKSEVKTSSAEVKTSTSSDKNTLSSNNEVEKVVLQNSTKNYNQNSDAKISANYEAVKSIKHDAVQQDSKLAATKNDDIKVTIPNASVEKPKENSSGEQISIKVKKIVKDVNYIKSESNNDKEAVKKELNNSANVEEKNVSNSTVKKSGIEFNNITKNYKTDVKPALQNEIKNVKADYNGNVESKQNANHVEVKPAQLKSELKVDININKNNENAETVIGKEKNQTEVKSPTSKIESQQIEGKKDKPDTKPTLQNEAKTVENRTEQTSAKEIKVEMHPNLKNKEEAKTSEPGAKSHNVEKIISDKSNVINNATENKESQNANSKMDEQVKKEEIKVKAEKPVVNEKEIILDKKTNTDQVKESKPNTFIEKDIKTTSYEKPFGNQEVKHEEKVKSEFNNLADKNTIQENGKPLKSEKTETIELNKANDTENKSSKEPVSKIDNDKKPAPEADIRSSEKNKLNETVKESNFEAAAKPEQKIEKETVVIKESVTKNDNNKSEKTLVNEKELTAEYKTSTDSNLRNQNSTKEDLSRNDQYKHDDHKDIKSELRDKPESRFEKELINSKEDFTKKVNNEFRNEQARFNSNNERIIKTAEIMREVAKHIQKQDKNTLVLQIDPENLGKMKIKLEMIENTLRAKIEVESTTIKQHVENNLNELQSQLSRSGIQLSGVNISLSDTDVKSGKQFSGSKKRNNGNSLRDEEIEITEESKVKSLGYNTYDYVV
jgi:hypothetical protein